ncbi:AvrD family protein [Photobacterium sp. 1_MG-2023]|uniref:AvrD family protein n=1 Tax=Photobacterium sp. 1_MG-2023 TaxID=3062646 RepID=UPI0026E36B05|nr:AvrD family protein [Photobacterium sp. 1_MG-2023]MDO6707321.1 AvrD family protein [Photobacterium sp. 1_MG-2023]
MQENHLAVLESECYEDIDQLLGHKETRYFGQGFKQVSYQIIEHQFHPEQFSFHAIVDVAYPSSWSKKGEKGLTPHLSTIDAMWLNCYACEQLLNAFFDMSEEVVLPLFRSVEMKAGQEPEEILSGVSLAVRLLDTVRIKEFYTYRSTLQIEVGSMKLQTIIEHGGVKRQTPVLMNANDETFFPFHYTDQCYRTIDPKNYHEIIQIQFRQDMKHIQGRMNISKSSAHPLCFLSPIEVIISLAQLAQALIYKRDNLNRKDSETLWMRTVLLENFTHYYDMNDCLVNVWMEKDRSVTKHGETWRMYRMLGTLGSSRCSYSLAHKLPSNTSENS